MYINDWYNDDVLDINLNGGTFDGWYYNRDYTKIYVETVEGDTITIVCNSTSENPDHVWD